MILLAVLLISMALLARASGGGFIRLKSPLDKVPEILFGIGFGVLYPSLWGLIAAMWAYAWMETGHGIAWQMGTNPSLAQSGRKQTLSFVVDPICRLLDKPLGGKFYCWLFMGLKGLLIGLAAWPFGCALAIAWPLAYYTGIKIKDMAFTDYAIGACSGLVIWLSWSMQ